MHRQRPRPIFIVFSIIILFFGLTAFYAKRANNDAKNILFFGDSLTAGYGLDPSEAFPALVQKKLDSLKLNFKVINAGLSGETSAGGLRRINWVLQNKVDILVLELGANDGLRGISLDDTEQNLQKIINAARKKYPSVRLVVAGMKVPPNLGPEYSKQFETIFQELAQKNEAALIPFLLEGVGGVPELNLRDRIHPNTEGHKRVAENVWQVLQALVKNDKVE